MRLSQEPCLGVKVNSKRPAGWATSQCLGAFGRRPHQRVDSLVIPATETCTGAVVGWRGNSRSVAAIVLNASDYFVLSSAAEAPWSHRSDEYVQTSGGKCDRSVFVRWQRCQRR